MLRYNSDSTQANSEISTIDAASSLIQNSNSDFLKIIDQNIERIYKEALCLRELTFSITDDILIFSEITKKIANILKVEKCAVYTLDENNQEYILESPAFGLYIAPMKLSRIRASLNDSQINLVVNQLFESENTKIAQLNLNGKVTGVLAVGNKLDNSEFDSEDEYFLGVCAKQIAIVIENNNLYRQVRAQAAREKVINRINNSIRSSIDINTILNTAVNELGSTLKVSICNVLKFVSGKKVALVANEYNSHGNKGSISVGTLISLENSEIIKKLFETKQSVVINDTATSPYIINCPATKYRIIDTIQAKSVLSVPIILEDKILGTISLNQCDRVRRWSQEEIQIVENVASQLAVAINQAGLVAKITALASKDELTGLLNRRSFYERFISELERVKRRTGYISLALFDIDHFKSFNDNWGHLAGDFVLREIGEIVQENVRKSDVASRYGGEEFALILPDTNIDAGYELLERLRSKIENYNFAYDTEKFKVTISGGIVQIDPLIDKNINLDYLISESIGMTDDLLYKAKRSGRNMICRD